ncbi:protein XNDC1N [Chamaea fasciata]|uniref:protein XNDC1N n=1 Tax=Chamaea fasciata TaxID=190680 RepID=UPI00336A793C
MTPADSKLDQNRCGVWMFKEADFSELTVGQKWDHVQLTCSQPFSPYSGFGLSFIRLRAPQEQEPDPPWTQRMMSSQTDPGAPALPLTALSFLNHPCKWPGVIPSILLGQCGLEPLEVLPWFPEPQLPLALSPGCWSPGHSSGCPGRS